MQLVIYILALFLHDPRLSFTGEEFIQRRLTDALEIEQHCSRPAIRSLQAHVECIEAQWAAERFLDENVKRSINALLGATEERDVLPADFLERREFCQVRAFSKAEHDLWVEVKSCLEDWDSSEE